MARPRDPNKRRIESDTYRAGYAVEMGGEWVVRVSSVKRRTGLQATDENVPAVKRIIDQTVEAYRAGQTVGKSLATVAAAQQATAATTPSLYTAASMWYDIFIAQKPNLGQAYRNRSWTMILAYTPPGRDIPLDDSRECVERLVRHFSAVKAHVAQVGYEPAGRQLEQAEQARRADQSQNTTRQRLILWKRICRWMVAMGYIRSNPIDLIEIPKGKRRTQELRQYSPAEYDTLIRRLFLIDRETWLLVLWLRFTGMRIHEALGMRRDDIAAGILTIRGKGYEGEKRVRRLPLRWYPAEDRSPVAKWQRVLVAILEAQLREPRRLTELYAAADRTGRISIAARRRNFQRGHIWGRVASSSYLDILNEAKQQAGIRTEDDITRAFHAFRAMAEHLMKHVLRLPRDLMLEITGHTAEVHEGHYAIDLSGAELLNELDRLVSGVPENHLPKIRTKPGQNPVPQVPQMPQGSGVFLANSTKFNR